MKRLGNKCLKTLMDRMDAATNAATWDELHAELDRQVAWVEFPTGILAIPFDENPIAGYILAWRKMGRIKIKRVERSDRFAEQGLGGKASIRTTLLIALLVMRELPRGYCQIQV